MPPTMSLSVTSTDFEEGKPICVKYAGVAPDGISVDTPLPSVSPPLRWDEPPSEAHYVVLLAYDPDAPVGVFAHWVVYDLPVGHHDLPAGASTEELGKYGATQGQNDFGHPGYNGPLPKGGKPHRYFFKVVAVKERLNLAYGATMDEVKAAMRAAVQKDKDYIVAWGQLVGTYGP